MRHFQALAGFGVLVLHRWLRREFGVLVLHRWLRREFGVLVLDRLLAELLVLVVLLRAEVQLVELGRVELRAEVVALELLDLAQLESAEVFLVELEFHHRGHIRLSVVRQDAPAHRLSPLLRPQLDPGVGIRGIWELYTPCGRRRAAQVSCSSGMDPQQHVCCNPAAILGRVAWLFAGAPALLCFASA